MWKTLGNSQNLFGSILHAMDMLKRLIQSKKLNLLHENAVRLSLNEFNTLYPGAHICTITTSGLIHHGIFRKLTDDSSREVIHLSQNGVRAVTLEEFLRDEMGCLRPLFLVQYEGDSAEARDDSLINAEAFLQSGLQYDPTVSNCEHFAVWCRTGQWESKQVQMIEAAVLQTYESFLKSTFPTI